MCLATTADCEYTEETRVSGEAKEAKKAAPVCRTISKYPYHVDLLTYLPLLLLLATTTTYYFASLGNAEFVLFCLMFLLFSVKILLVKEDEVDKIANSKLCVTIKRKTVVKN